MANEKILIVEDEGLVAEDIKAHLVESGWDVVAIVPSGEQALELMDGIEVDLVMMDIVLTGVMDGIDTAAFIQEKYQTPVIFLTAYTDREKVDRAQLTDPYGYLIKPFDERELKTTVAMSLSKSINDRAQREGKRWANAVLKSIEDGVITTDTSGRIRNINPNALMMTSKSLDDCMGQFLIDVLSFADTSLQLRLKSIIDEVLQFGKADDYRISGQLATLGEAVIVDAKIASITYDEGKPDGLVMALHNITQEHDAKLKMQQYNAELEARVKERTIEIKHALDKAEAASAAKSRFLSNISHELRTPLNPIAAYSQMLMVDATLDDKQKALAEKIYSSSDELLEKINNLITLSSLDIDEFTINKVLFNPVLLVRDIIQSFEHQAKAKNLLIEEDIADNMMAEIQGDMPRLKSILHHLVHNALKFTSQGKVSLSITNIKESDDSVVYRFTVKDTGTGLADTNIADIFNEFTQGDGTRKRKHDGLGIGLTLCKKLIHHLNGSIAVEPNTSGGSIFWFELSFQKA